MSQKLLEGTCWWAESAGLTLLLTMTYEKQTWNTEIRDKYIIHQNKKGEIWNARIREAESGAEAVMTQWRIAMMQTDWPRSRLSAKRDLARQWKFAAFSCLVQFCLSLHSKAVNSECQNDWIYYRHNEKRGRFQSIWGSEPHFVCFLHFYYSKNSCTCWPPGEVYLADLSQKIKISLPIAIISIDALEYVIYWAELRGNLWTNCRKPNDF